MHLARKVAIIVSAMGMVFSLAHPVAAQDWRNGNGVEETEERDVALDSGGTLTLNNINGAISVESWDQPTLRLVATKKARRAEDLERLEVQVNGAGAEVEVLTLYDGASRNVKGSISYRLTVPREVDLTLTTVNGSVKVANIRGRVTANSVNGSVKIAELAGSASVQTTNGSVEVRYVEARGGDHQMSSTNGSLTLYLPSNAGGELEARTSNGRVRVDFPVSATRQTRRRFEGSFGNGSERYSLKTTNGSVRIAEN